MTATSPRLVLLSDHGAHSQRIAENLVARSVKLDAVLVHQAARPRDLSGAIWNRGALWELRLRIAFERHQRSFYAPLGCRVLPTGAMNSAAMLASLRRLSPDYILVGSTKILSAAIIETARCGVLNAHPGLLPWLRGSGVVPHAIENGVAIGATLHYIDAGIDTGALIERRLLPVHDAGTTLKQLERKTDELRAQMMAEYAETIARTGQKPPTTPQIGRFPLFRWQGAEKRRETEALTQTGRAAALFEAWQTSSRGAPDWILPPDLMDAPYPIKLRQTEPS